MGVIRTTVAAGAALCCLLIATELADRFGDGVTLIEEPIESARLLANEGRWAEVKMLTDYLAEKPELAEPHLTDALSQQAETELTSFLRQAQRFADGAVTGEPTDWVSMLGSLSLDLFVLGDIRDLAVQGWQEVYYGSGDTVIIALSAIGLTTTLAPHIDWAPALIKAMKRTGAFTKSFSKNLLRASRQALRSGKYTKLSGVVTDMGKAATHLGPGPLRGVMHAVDSMDELHKVAKAAEIDAKGTYALGRLAGKNGVKRISQDGKNISSLAASLKVGSRTTKIAKKLFAAVPTLWLFIVLACTIALLAAILIPRSAKNLPARHRTRTTPESIHRR